MKVYISVDIEGVAGVATLDQVIRGEGGYPEAQHLMTGETNAAAAGAFDAGAESVLVNDSHGAMDNLLHEQLDPRIRLVFGAPKPDCMMEGIAPEHDVAFLIGYHAAAGAPGILAHTFSPHFLEVRLNGVAASEAEINGLQAAAAGVPIGLLTGDNVICAAARLRFPGITTVTVKTARGFSAAESLSPIEARQAIQESAAKVVANAAHLQPQSLPDILVVEIDMPHATAAERGSLIHGVERLSDRTLRATVAEPRDALAFIMVTSQLAAGAMRGRLALIRR